jgi:ABC-type microcin C transport system duplicated ATPase subunit YejF
MSEPILAAEHIVKRFHKDGGLFTRGKTVTALDDVDLSLNAGETLALVGESGSGKSTLARALMRLIRTDSGRVLFSGRDTAELRGKALMAFQRRVQMVFQDPFASLNPRLSVGRIVAEPLVIHGLGDAAERHRGVAATLESVGLSSTDADRAPHAFSGGQRQRIAIARALIVNPEVVILDEPLSALDVTVQRQILGLLNDLKAHHRLAYLFITHDLGVARALSDRIAVMHRGRVVEIGPTETVFNKPTDSYTQRLLAAVPVLGAGRRHAGARR